LEFPALGADVEVGLEDVISVGDVSWCASRLRKKIVAEKYGNGGGEKTRNA